MSVSGWCDDTTAPVVAFPFRRSLPGSHAVDGLFGQVAFTVDGSVVHEHLVEAREVFCGGEEAADGHGMAGGFVFERVGENRDRCWDEAFPCVVGFVGGCEAFLLFGGWMRGGVFHSERFDDARLDELVVRLAAYEFDDASEDGVATVGVCGTGAGFESERGDCVGSGADIEWPRVPGGEVKGGFGSKAGHVTEEMVDPNGGFDGFDESLLWRF